MASSPQRRGRLARETQEMTQTLGEEIIAWIETLRVPEGALVLTLRAVLRQRP
jgi:hypothetical protein